MNQAHKLEKLQFYSLISTAVSTGIGFLQAFFVLRILLPEEYGLVGLLSAIGSMVGVVQHLGLVSGSVREISLARNLNEAFKIAFVSLVLRLIISIPLAFVLIIISKFIALKVYETPWLIHGLYLFAVILVFQGFQEILGATLRGLQKFKHVFLLEVTYTACSFIFYIPLTYYFRANGYIYAMLCTTIIMVLLYSYTLREFVKSAVFPNWAEFKSIFDNLFNLARVLYGIKIIHNLWLQGGVLILGKYATATQVGYCHFCITYAGKLMRFNRAINIVNVPSLSQLFAEDYHKFQRTFKRNFTNISVFLLWGTVSLISFADYIVALLGGSKYQGIGQTFSYVLIGFVIYASYNLIGGGALLPGNQLKGVLSVHLISRSVGIFVSWVFIINNWGADGVAIGLIIGAMPILIAYIIFLKRRLDIQVLDLSYLLLLLVPLTVISFFLNNFFVTFIVWIISTLLYFLVLHIFNIFKFPFILPTENA